MTVSAERDTLIRGDHKLVVHRVGDAVDLYLFERKLNEWVFLFRYEFKSAEAPLDIIIDMLTRETMFFASSEPR
jgi:hypothetical protein